MKSLYEALSKSMIKKISKRSLNDTYYIVIPINIQICINKTDAIFVDNKNFNFRYSSFFIATKEQAQKLKDITRETNDLIFAINDEKQYHTIEEIIDDYVNDYLKTQIEAEGDDTNLIDVTDQFN